MSSRRAVAFVASVVIVLTVMGPGTPTAMAFTESDDNNFFGTGAGASTTGEGNSFFGAFAGATNTTGTDNTFFGRAAGFSNTEGGANAFFGRGAGFTNTTGEDNAFFGNFAGASNTTGSDNAYFGFDTGVSNTAGAFNAFFGRSAGRSNTTGSFNAFFGRDAGRTNTTGGLNAFFGRDAGFANTIGGFNAFFGDSSGRSNTSGLENSFFGHNAGVSNTVENANSFIGSSSNGVAGITNATALGRRSQVSQSNSLVLGSIDGLNGATESVNVGIGTPTPTAPLHVVKTTPGGVAGSIGQGALVVNRTDGSPANIRFSTTPRSYLFQNNPSNQVFSIINETAGNTPVSVFPDAGSNAFVLRAGRLGLGVGAPAAGRAIDTNTGAFLSTAGVWTNASSRSLKTNIDSLSIEEALGVLRALDPVTFEYKKAPGDGHLGFIAEDVPDIVATAGRQGLSPMDIVAVAVRVLQAKDAENAALETRVAALEAADD